MTDHTSESIPTKQCNRCREWKPATAEYFSRQKDSSDGLYSLCKTCKRVVGRAWWAANADRINESRRSVSPEQRKENNEYGRERRAANRERLNEIRRPKRVIEQKARETRKRSLPMNFTETDWLHALNYFGGCCAICRRSPGLFHTLSQDHWIPLSDMNCPGTIPTNIVPLCHGIDGCNASKRNRYPLEWLIWKFGKEKGKQIAARIEEYFDSLRSAQNRGTG